MLAKNNSKTTIGMYARAIRVIFNEVDAQKIIRKQDHYPFGRRKYVIPKTRNVKKSLTIDDIAKTYYYEPTCESEAKARDYWLFCYFGNGMNAKDFLLLKFKTIHDEFMVFERAKTEAATRSNPIPITVYLIEEMWQIIDRWGNKDKSPNNYIFPVL